MFLDREDAGQKLALEIEKSLKGAEVMLFAIPNGGVAVALPVFKRLKVPFDLVIPRKIPIPTNTEAGFGAVGPDGTIVLNDALAKSLQLTAQEIDDLARVVTTEIKRRDTSYRQTRPYPDLSGKHAVLIDDGLASGYTMIAAIRFLRTRNPEKIVVAVPVTSDQAAKLVEKEADQFIALHRDYLPLFAVASFYKHWKDLTDEEVISLLQTLK
ncbi:MAG TPA: phosphoribosyltransferase family protein [Candidatus Subteraquimicrobiales bacterium]